MSVNHQIKRTAQENNDYEGTSHGDQADSGNADLGFIALSQLRTKRDFGGSSWEVPADYYRPIEQQVILLRSSRQPEAAQQLLNYLRSAEACEILERFGYGGSGG